MNTRGLRARYRFASPANHPPNPPATSGFLAGVWAWIKDNPGVSIAIFTFLAVLVISMYRGVRYETIMSEVARDYELAQQRNDLVDDHVELGRAFLGVQNLEAARAEFNEALEFEPTHPAAQEGLSITNIFEPIMKNHYDAEVASKRFDFLLEKRRDDPILLMIRGEVSLDQGRLEEALGFFDDALAQESDLPHAYAGKGEVFAAQGKTADAIDMFSRAVGGSPGNVIYINGLAYQLMKAERYQEALAQFEELLRLDPNYILAHVDEANIYRLQGSFAEAFSHNRVGIQLISKKPLSAAERNSVYWYFLTDSGSRVLVKTLPEKLYYMRNDLALTAYLLGRVRTARTELNRAVKLNLVPKVAKAIRAITLYDISLLARKQPRIARRLPEFRRMLMRGSRREAA